jgi:hypothetical protein
MTTTIPSKRTFTFPSLPPPHDLYGTEDAATTSLETASFYSQQWKAYQHTLRANDTARTIVHELVWIVAPSHQQLYLMACTNEGWVYVWHDPPHMLHHDTPYVDHDNHHADDTNSHSRMRHPMAARKVSTGALYTMGITDSKHVALGGDEGVILVLLDELLPIDTNDKSNTAAPSSSSDTPIPRLAHYRPYPSPCSLSGPSSVQQVALCQSTLWAATRDAYGCYKWDLETQQLVRHIEAPYSSTVAYLPGSHPVVLTGSSRNGILRIWDPQHDQLVDAIPIVANGSTGSSKSSESLTKKPRIPRKANTGVTDASTTRTTATSIASCGPAMRDSEEWWCVAGGNNIGSGGYLSTWHAPTRTCLAHVSTDDCPWRVVPTITSLVSVGNTARVRQWSSLSLHETTPPMACSAKAGHAIAVAPDGRMAVGGVGRTIDIYEASTVCVYTLTLDLMPTRRVLTLI